MEPKHLRGQCQWRPDSPFEAGLVASAKSIALIAAASFALIGCGGGGGGSATTPAVPAPAPPPPDTTGPGFAAAPNISPAVGTTNAEYLATVSFTASEPLSSATIKLVCATVNVAGSTAVQGAVATFTPAGPGLAPQDDCVATVDAAKDAAGNAWNGPAAITQFRVKALDCPPPTKALAYTGGKTNSVCDNVFVDENGPRNGWPLTLKIIRDAEARVRNFYGPTAQGTVDFMFCGTTACSSFYTAGINRPMFRSPNFYINGVLYERGMVVNMGVGSASNLGILAHELAHGELRARTSRFSQGGIPAWFDEGLATLVGGDRELSTCAGFNGVPDLRALDFGYQWVEATSNVNTAGTVYCQAQREVDAWHKRVGNAGLLALIQRVNAGEGFYTVYGAMNY